MIEERLIPEMSERQARPRAARVSALPARRTAGRKVARRVIVCLCVCVAIVLGFYLSLIFTARSLSIDEKYRVRRGIEVLHSRGFTSEARLLETVTQYRGSDNWLNASVAKESAYAATNFPFAILTLYPEFFTYPTDDTERAAILLHEAKHIQGADEVSAYEFVWKNREKLGWTRDAYITSAVWRNVRVATRNNVPALFECPSNEFSDCTE